MAEKQSEKSSQSVLARNAGAFLMAAALCALGAVMAYGSTLKVNSLPVIGFLVVGLACLGAWFVGRAQQAAMPRDQWAKQRSLIGANSMISTLLFFVVLIGVNYVAARRHKTFDLTSNKINVLSPQSDKALQKLAAPVTLSYVYAPSQSLPMPGPAEMALLDKYKNASDKIRVNIVNAVEEPGKLEALSLTGFTGRPVVLAKSESKSGGHQQIDIIDEQNLTSALMKLDEQKVRVFYHLIGHGEASLDGGNASFSQAQAKLTSQGYTFKPLSLASANAKIPGDAAIIAVLGPTSDLSPREAKIFKNYLGEKGHLLLLLAPSSRPMPQWRALAKALGVTLLDGFVADPQQYVSSPQMPVVQVSDVTKHAVLGGVGQNSVVEFFGALPMQVTSPPGITTTSVLESSPASKSVPFGRTGAMKDGPFTLLAAAEKSAQAGAPPGAANMRAIFVGSGQLGADTNFGAYANGDMLLSAVNWVAGNDLLVSIPPKEPVRNTLEMPPVVRRFAVIFSVFALPLAILLMGGLVWWKRR